MIKMNSIILSLSVALGAAVSSHGEILLSENFESPDASATSVLQDGGTYSKGQLPDNGNWVRSTQGFGADRMGLINKVFGDYTAPFGNSQALYLGYTNSGITSSTTAISHTLELGATYTLSFDVARDNNVTQSSYSMQLVAFDSEENNSVRNDVRPASSPGVVLASVSGIVTTNDLSERVTMVFTTDANVNQREITKPIGIRFLGNSSHPILDNVELAVEGGSGQGNIGDSDGDGLPDAWEIANFGDLSHDGNSDSDGDGLTDAFEYLVNLDPNDYDSVDGIPDWVGYLVPVNSETLLSENFESPDVSSTSVLQDGGTYKKGALPDNGNWIGSSQGFGSDRKGLIRKDFGDYTALEGNNQGLYFGYSNSGITSSAASISHVLKPDVIYVLSFDVTRDNDMAQSSYAMELLAFSAQEGDAVRNDVRSGIRPGVVLSSASGIVTSNDMSKRVSIIFKPDASLHAAETGKSLGIRFIGNSSHPILDNVVLTAIDSVGKPGYLTVEQWDNVPGQTLADLFASQAFYEPANWIYLTPQAKSLSNVGDDYGLRMTGRMISPYTGDVHFRLSSGGQCKLFLSTDEKGFNRREIAAAENAILEEDWYNGSESSRVNLVAGKEYYIEVLMKEDIGDDHVTVAWQPVPYPFRPGLHVIPLAFEIIPGTNLKSYVPDPGDLDDDGMLDSWEVLVGLDSHDNGRTNRIQGSYADIDGDGLLNYEEYQHNTSPFNADSDGDGMPDGWEVENGLKPDSLSDADLDADGDGLSNLGEYQAGTDPNDIYSGGSVAWPQDAIVAWYRTDGNDITVDEAGLVSSWKNSVGDGHLMAQGDVAKQPELVKNVLNGQDAVRFAETDSVTIASDGLDMLTPESSGFSVVGVFKTPVLKTPTTEKPISSLLYNETYMDSGFRMGVYDDQLSWWSDESGGTLEKGGLKEEDHPQWVYEDTTYQFGLHHQGSSSQDLTEISVNGILQSSFSGKLIKGNTNPIRLQSIGETTIQPGDWGELIIANRVLNRGESTLVADYLRGKLQGAGPLALDNDGDGKPDWNNYPPTVEEGDLDQDGSLDATELAVGTDPTKKDNPAVKLSVDVGN